MKAVILIVLILLVAACDIQPEWEIAPVTTMVSGDDVPRRLRARVCWWWMRRGRRTRGSGISAEKAVREGCFFVTYGR